MKYTVLLNACYHRTRWISDIVCPMHIQKTMEIIIVTDGLLKMNIKGREYHIPAGSAVFAEPFDPHSFQSDQPNKCIVLEFSPDLHEIFWKWLETHDAQDRMISLPDKTYAYLLSLIPPETQVYQGLDTSHLQAILMPLCHAFLQGCSFEETPRKKHSDLLLQALDIITKTPPETLSLKTVAKQLGIRPDSLSRIFVEQSDVTFHSYVQNLRICSACALLCQGVPITEAAYQAGFGSICSFNRVFKQIMDCTPREFIRQNDRDERFSDRELTEPCVNYIYVRKEPQNDET
ncbi:MAG: helix-turn-helix transcriptional regulator [Lachnospiraceae bacterium]|nr:helix-turn-helix transcriptional regulator [Lachnospiraceae bacterium]